MAENKRKTFPMELPLEKFDFSSLMTVEEVQKLQALDLEFRLRITRAESYRPSSIRARIRAARANSIANPSLEALDDLEDETSIDQKSTSNAERFRFLRNAAYRSGLSLYREEVVARLDVIFTRALEIYRAEIDLQQRREEQWQEVWGVFKAWAGRYGFDFIPVSQLVSASMTKYADRLEASRLVLGNLDKWSTDLPPNIINLKLSILGLRIETLSE